jgi:hypothetical protein
MDNLCNCPDCERSYRDSIEGLNLTQFIHDMENNCSSCSRATCLNHEVYRYLSTHFPNNTFTKDYLLDPEKFPKELRPGICNYLYITGKHFRE